MSHENPLALSTQSATPLTPYEPGTLPDFAPVPRLRARSNGWSPDVQRRFIEALAETGSVDSACRRVGRASVGAYQLRCHPQGEGFRQAWEAALAIGVQRIEDVAMERALNGVEIPVYSYGKLVGTRRSYNDRLLMFLLRNRAPERFTEGRSRGLSALDTQQIARMKKEWERQHAMETTAAGKEAGDSFIAKVEEMHDGWLARMSPKTRTAYIAFRAAEDEDRLSQWSWIAATPEADRPRILEENSEWIALNKRTYARARIWRLIDMRGSLDGEDGEEVETTP